MRILVVDDSVVFRTQIVAALSGIEGVEVAGTAANGKIALQKLEQDHIDLVTLDVEMPEMDGISTLREIRKRGFKTRVIMFSALTSRGAEKALEALREGADDIAPKPSGPQVSFENAAHTIRDYLVPRVLQFFNIRAPAARPIIESPISSPGLVGETKKQEWDKRDLSTFLPEIVVIASSTGGPSALEKTFASIQAPTRVPILIAQHMPPVFTAILAKRIGELTGVPTAEAVSGEDLVANRIYVAPGDFHMRVRRVDGKFKVILDQEPQRNSVRPAADHLFESVVELFSRRTMGFVFTGMGEDGLAGCKAIKGAGGGVVIQNQASCVVFGMPGAVYEVGCYDGMGDLDYMANSLRRMVS